MSDYPHYENYINISSTRFFGPAPPEGAGASG